MNSIVRGVLSAAMLLILSVFSNVSCAYQADAQPAETNQTPLPHQSIASEGTVTVGGNKIPYLAETGLMNLNTSDVQEPVISLFYVAYFKKTQRGDRIRPITFIYNGGPGSASVWLHMAALGPKRVALIPPQTNQLTSTPLKDNAFSLLDVSDLVFIDAPGTGYSRFISNAGSAEERAQQKADSAKSVYSIRGDAGAFTQFIVQFLTTYQRWDAPKYLLGESYGTTRTIALAQELKKREIDVNGIILLSAFLNFNIDNNDAGNNPGIDQSYFLTLPSYAATAWYYHRLAAGFQNLPALLQQVETFANGPYAQALIQGNALKKADRLQIARQLSQFTAIPADVWLRANLRLSVDAFVKRLLQNSGQVVSKYDTRYSGPEIDSLSMPADYDPLPGTLGPSLVAQFHRYLQSSLRWQSDEDYHVSTDASWYWNLNSERGVGRFNLLPDLAQVMKMNPAMRVLVMGGIYDLSTPWYVARYDMMHLPVPDSLMKNISYSAGESGHLPYADEAGLKKSHTDISAFIGNTGS